jgi:hypothetical protein
MTQGRGVSGRELWEYAILIVVVAVVVALIMSVPALIRATRLVDDPDCTPPRYENGVCSILDPHWGQTP